MSDDERLSRIEAILKAHDKQLSSLSGADESYKRWLKDMMSNLDEDNIPSLRFKVTNKDMTAAIDAAVGDTAAQISLVTAYTGMDGVTAVDTLAERTDTSKVYKVGTTYYKWNGAEWVGSSSMAEASFLLAVMNGQSAAKLKADNIDLIGNVTIASVDGLKDGTVEVNGGCLMANTVLTDALKPRRTANIDWFDFYAGIDMSVIDVTKSTYYSETRQISGLKRIRLFKDTNLASGGNGQTGNSLIEVGNLTVDTYGMNTLLGTSFISGVNLSNTLDSSTALELTSTASVMIGAGLGAGNIGIIELFALDPSNHNSGYSIQLSSNGVSFFKTVNGVNTALEQWF